MEGIKILVIDDDVLLNMLTDALLEEAESIREYAIKNSGSNALIYLEKCVEKKDFPDLILVDLKMPEMNGFEFIEHFEERFWDDHKSAKVLVVSSSVSKRDKEKSLQYRSVNGFINKPLTDEFLMSIVETVQKAEK